jgi:hypothetical protein
MVSQYETTTRIWKPVIRVNSMVLDALSFACLLRNKLFLITQSSHHLLPLQNQKSTVYDADRVCTVQLSVSAVSSSGVRSI